MTKTLNEYVCTLPKESQERIESRTQELIRQTSLREIRKSLGLTQKQLADVLSISQSAVSK